MEILEWSNEDRLSNLPPNVLDAIFMLLPIKDAVRTSILSSKWRYRWNIISHLVFNEECIPTTCMDSYVTHLLCINIVDQVLLHHHGPIHKFQCSSYLESCPDIDRWIVFLSNHGIQEFILHCLEGETYKVPSRLFSCEQLRRLELTDCIIKPLPKFSCSVNLKILALHGVTMDGEALKSLLLHCKFLEDLTLVDIDDLPRPEILALKLKRLLIRGSFGGLLLDTPLLESATIDLLDDVEEEDEEEDEEEKDDDGDDEEEDAEEEEELSESCTSNLIKVLGSLQYIQKLVVENCCLQFLALGEVSLKLLTTYKHLKYLSLSIDFSSVEEIDTAFCLITSAPCLEILKIHSMAEESFDSHDFAWEASDFTLNWLHTMEMTRIVGGENELDVLEFVLANSPLLGTMTVQLSYSADEAAFLRSLVRFRRASAKATVICLIEDDE